MKLIANPSWQQPKDNLSDAWVSIGTTVGIIGSQFNLPWIDPLAALIVGFLICKTAWDIFREATHFLTDGFDENEIKSYKETIKGTYGVKGIKDIKARNYGNNVVVDVVILVNSNLDVTSAHDIATRVEDELIKKITFMMCMCMLNRIEKDHNPNGYKKGANTKEKGSFN